MRDNAALKIIKIIIIQRIRRFKFHIRKILIFIRKPDKIAIFKIRSNIHG